MTKEALVKWYSEYAQISKAEARKQWDDVNGFIETVLKNGNDISLKGVGTIKCDLVKEREHHNPLTGQKIMVAAHYSPKMKFFPSFRSVLRALPVEPE